MATNDLSYTLKLKDLFSKTIQGATNQVKGLDSKMNNFKNRLGGVGAAIAGAFAIGSVVSFGKSIIASLKNYEYFHASLKVLLNNNVGATKALETQLVSLAATTPFSLTDFQDSTKKLLAYGFRAGEVVETMRTLGDVSSATGNNIGDVAYLYGTLKTQGKAMTKDLYQFTNRGINLLPQLAKQFGVTEDKIYDLASSGKISFANIEQAFKSMTKEGGQFFGMMAEQSKTVGGRLSNMEDSWGQLKVNIGKSQTGIISGTVGFINSLVSNLNKGIEATNLLEQSFSNFGAKKYSAFEKYFTGISDKTIGKLFGLKNSGQYAEMQAYAGSMKEQYVGKSTDKLSALKNQASLAQIIANVLKDSSVGKIEKERRVAVLRSLMKENTDILGLQSMKGEANKLDENGNLIGSSKESKLNTGTEVTGSRPQSLTINITKLVEALNVQTTNLTEGTAKIKEMVSKALLEAVNDVNLMQMV